MPKLHVKTGDEVIVLAGKDAGKRGKVTQVFPEKNRVVVEGLNLMKRHLKPRRADTPGQIVEFSMPMHASNVKRFAAEKAEKKTKKAKA